MDILVKKPKQYSDCTIKLPASKSISNRLLLLNALSYSPYEIENLSDSDDTKVMLKVLNSNDNYFDIGAAGTSMRFLTAFLSKVVGEWVLTGSERMKQRPIGILVDALRHLGARIEYEEKEGYPPLRIYGSSLIGGDISLPGNISSQYISALLMIAPQVENGLTIHLEGEIISRPYIDLTLALMEEFGVKAIWQDERTIIIPEANYRPKPVRVEGDWSAASYWFEIAALNPGLEITLQGLGENSLQGDSRVREIFNNLGVNSEFTGNGLKILSAGKVPERFDYDFTNQPDLAQTVVVTCCMLNVQFNFTGLQTLKIKETDRINALITELSKAGYVVTTNNADTMMWSGEKTKVKGDKPVEIDTYKDHRMAMAFAPATSVLSEVVIKDSGVVSKSYPDFWEDLLKAGYIIQKPVI
ncbi:MAG: 3-phosphoshikimate 1-carboxyvinyltransferase [Chlorobi bacterium]|nr:3-phosphoshikimate 1-carboxyvinyltransferase [Chlorobiota bacterium]